MNYNWDWSVFFKSTGIGQETYLDWFISGLGWTIAIAVVAWIVALMLGSLLGVMRTLPNRFISGIATVYVEIFRNVPLLVQLFMWYFLVPDLLPQHLQDWYKQDLNPTTSAYLSVVVCLGLLPLHGFASRYVRVSKHCHVAKKPRPEPWGSNCRRFTGTSCCPRLIASSFHRSPPSSSTCSRTPPWRP